MSISFKHLSIYDLKPYLTIDELIEYEERDTIKKHALKELALARKLRLERVKAKR